MTKTQIWMLIYWFKYFLRFQNDKTSNNDEIWMRLYRFKYFKQGEHQKIFNDKDLTQLTIRKNCKQ